MKKNFRVLAAIGIFAALGASYSCQKEVTAEPLVVDTSKTVTIHGLVYADLDLTKDGLEKVTDQKVLITAELNSYYYLSGKNSSQNWSKVVDVKDGKFDVVIPSTSGGVKVTVTPIEFTAKQTQPAGAPLAEVVATFKGKSNLPDGTSLKANENKYVTIEYTAEKKDPSTYGVPQTATFHGTVLADLDLSKIGKEKVTGTVLIEGKKAGVSQWKKNVAVTDGKFDVVLPVNEGETVTVTPLNFTATQKQAFDNTIGAIPADSTKAFELVKEWSGSLLAGSEVYNEFTFKTGITIGSTVKMVTVKGKANIIKTWENKTEAYSGSITFYSDDASLSNKWTFVTTISQFDGSFTIEVPANCTIKASYTGTYNEGKIAIDGVTSTSDVVREYIYGATLGKFSVPKTFDKNFTLTKETRNN